MKINQVRQPLLSIIIPIHNGENEIARCLNSIYSHNITQEQLEVICVDDASTDETYKLLSMWKNNKENLRIIRHGQNKRQGGARNSGMNIAQGKYVTFLDHDDVYVPGGLENVINLLSQLERQNPGHSLDILMFDYIKSDDPDKKMNYSHNSPEMMPGYSFLSQQECSWYVWHYLYRMEYLRSKQRKFREYVLFEDSDFILGVLAHAHRVQYIPMPLVCYFVSGTRIGQTTASDMQKLIDQRLLSCMAIKNEARIMNHADAVEGVRRGGGGGINIAYKELMKHFSYKYGYIIMESLWRFSYAKRRELIKTHPAYYEGFPSRKEDFLTFLAYRFPTALNITISLGKPILYILLQFHRYFKK